MKTFTKLTILLAAFFTASCSNVMISDNEDKAMKEIAGLYGGTCTLTDNITASTKYGTKKTIEIEVNNSEFLNENTKWTEMFAANMAYVFFTFIKPQKEKYDNIKSVIVYNNGGRASFDYSIDSLEIVERKMAFVTQVINTLKNQDYEMINKSLKAGVFLNEKNKGEYISKIRSADTSFGNLIDFTPTGFRFNSAANGIKFLHISGNLKRSKQDTQFSIDINPEAEEDELYFLGYEY